MRKIDKLARDAFLNGVEFKQSNTSVKFKFGFIILYLHENPIARRRPVDSFDSFEVSLGGYPISMTTKNRLNALPGVLVQDRIEKAFLNGEPWDGDWTVISMEG